MIDLKNKLARFCPYTTLKNRAENPSMQHIRERKSVFIILALAISLMVPIAYSLLSGPQTKLVTLSDLMVKVVTDEKEYGVNETIRASLIVCNNNSYPVKLEPIREIYMAGSVLSEFLLLDDGAKVNGILLLDYPADYQYMFIEANSCRVIHEHEFIARHTGEFFINILGASTAVRVT